MIGGIFETIGRTLGVGKEKFFLELDEAAETAENLVEKVKAPAAKAVAAVKELSEDVVDKASDAVDKAKDAAAKGEDTLDKAAAKNGAKAPDKKAAKKTAAKKGANQNGANSMDADSTQVATLPPAPPTTEELIVKAIAAGGKKTDAQGNIVEETQNFSTDHLMPLGNRSRRRPGPSLSAFKGMAKEVNPRLRN